MTEIYHPFPCFHPHLYPIGPKSSIWFAAFFMNDWGESLRMWR
jgi:hypothetical protein